MLASQKSASQPVTMALRNPLGSPKWKKFVGTKSAAWSNWPMLSIRMSRRHKELKVVWKRFDCRVCSHLNSHIV